MERILSVKPDHPWSANDRLNIPLAKFAALGRQMDLIISVDTSVAHFAGALGLPVRLLTRFDSCRQRDSG
jgi:ADP-heptose:LPS heptosyltransferase